MIQHKCPSQYPVLICGKTFVARHRCESEAAASQQMTYMLHVFVAFVQASREVYQMPEQAEDANC